MNSYSSSSERMAEVVARARRRWQTQPRAAEPADVLAPPRPLALSIAISREAGANGSVVGRLVGERLGWPVYDRELVEHIAGEMGLRTTLLESVDEKRGSWLREFAESFASGRPLTEGAYVRQLVETLLTLAMHGECVLVGRGATAVVPPETALRVRLVAALRDRVATIQKRLSLSAEEARRWVERTDRDRANFVRDHFHQAADDPRQYDLVLNTSRFSVEEGADLVIEALRRMQARAGRAVKIEVPAGTATRG